MDQKKWAFELGDPVEIKVSHEKGKVSARAEYDNNVPDNFLVEYVDGSGCSRSDWFRGDQLSYDNN